MTKNISSLAEVHPDAEIGAGVMIGPFCTVGPNVKLGAGTILDNNVSMFGNTYTPCFLI